MFLIRDIFYTKPGKAKDLVAKFKASVEHLPEGIKNARVMTDFVATYWTVVLQIEVDELSVYTDMARSFTSKPEVQEIMKGYMDLVTGGKREIFKVE